MALLCITCKSGLTVLRNAAGQLSVVESRQSPLNPTPPSQIWLKSPAENFLQCKHLRSPLGLDFLIANGMMMIMLYRKIIFLKHHFVAVKAPFKYLSPHIPHNNNSFDLLLSIYSILEISYIFTTSCFINKKTEAQRSEVSCPKSHN